MIRYFLFPLFLLFCITTWSQQPIPNFSISSNSICQGDCITIINNSSNGTSFSWSFIGANPSFYQGENPGEICFNSPGSFNISLTVSNSIGSISSSQIINVTAIPTVSATISDTLNGSFIEIPDTTIDMYQSAYLWAEGLPSGGSMFWAPSNNIDDSISVSNGDSLTVNPFYTTYYVVNYTLNGCTATDTVLVNVNYVYDNHISVPNSFSPNGDNKNDFLRVLTNIDADDNFTNGFREGGAIAELDFKIYNHAGQLVFRTTDPHEGWDGKFKGEPENPASFVYILDYRLINGISASLNGNVTLFR
jgi:gliding motility-associated-like protein